jgi:hypothetical protein
MALLQLEFVCRERYGTHLRHVREVEATLEIEEYLRERLPPNPSETPMKSLEHIYSKGSRLFLVDDVGMMLAGVLELDEMRDVHICFWDRVLWGREFLCRSMAERVAREGELRGVWTAVPWTSRATLAFARRVGFAMHKQLPEAALLTMLIT